MFGVLGDMRDAGNPGTRPGLLESGAGIAHVPSGGPRRIAACHEPSRKRSRREQEDGTRFVSGVYQIPLTRGYVALVDQSDYQLVRQYTWHAAISSRGMVYASTHITTARLTSRHVFMHRMILGALKGEEVDHIDGNGCNNQRANLRVCTSSQNKWNQRPRAGSSSFKGVMFCPRRKKWRGQIKFMSRGFHLGYFESEIEAARAYDAAASEHFGEFARLNFPAEAAHVA